VSMFANLNSAPAGITAVVCHGAGAS
jgi:hypothetical protein